MKVAIIGGGFSGTVLAVGLLRSSLEPIEIFLLEKTGNFGAGVAYATDDSLHLLNVPASRMSAIADEPDHFVRWLGTEASPDAFVPRSLYRKYLQELLDEAQANPHHPGSSLRRIVDEAVSVSQDETQFRVETKGQRKVVADYLVLATGHLPETRFGQGKAFFERSGNHVVLIGSGLTAVDAALSVLSHPGKVVTAISRHGCLPETYDVSAPAHALSQDFGRSSLRPILRSLRREIENASDWQSVFNALRPRWEEIWQALPVQDQRRFLKHLAWRFEKYRHRIPPAAAAALRDFAAQGRFRILKGTVTRLSPRKVLYRADREDRCIEADQVLDCSGRSVKWSKTGDPLLRDLFAKGYIAAGPHGFGIAATDACQVVGSTRLFAIGPMLKGARWETTAVAELRAQAVTIRNAILG